MEKVRDIQITITSNCVKCGRCSEICPSGILIKNSITGDIEVHQKQQCVICGQCAAICPTKSVLHSAFPKERLHSFDTKDCPSAEQFLLLCKKRRSNRAFSNELVPYDFLVKIIEAGHYAPTAHNSQNVEFTLITSPHILQALTKYTLDKYGKIVNRLTHPAIMRFIRFLKSNSFKYLPMMQRVIKEYENGNDLILREATAVILIHTDNEDYFGSTNAHLAYQNASLMAESLNVSQFYMGFLCSAISLDKRGELTKVLGVKGTIHAAMALGIPKFNFKQYMDRTDLEFTKL